MDIPVKILRAILRPVIREEIRTFIEKVLVQEPNKKIVINEDEYIDYTDNTVGKPSKIK